jgi:hypothetical protein
MACEMDVLCIASKHVGILSMAISEAISEKSSMAIFIGTNPRDT